eukprot:TRINITY_DN9772_c0_g1_i3.p1 TRINITY_DN9772_c0_g1~~TRINITY_DN9772_c0_g1_i3.p1  ORF type:complete len:248 (-),score=54.54 TRINITY_DN9772_c0_g1_i3:140-811(-)
MSLRVLLLLSLLGCALSALPPLLPPAFYGEFIEYTAPLAPPPPYVNGLPPPPFKASRGLVYYNWAEQAMIENRLDYCVNIFPTGNDFPCIFHNVNGVSYLISTNTTTQQDSCCIFGKPWHPPRPTFLRTDLPATYNTTEVWEQGKADWYVVNQVAPPTGPFWYAFRAPSAEVDVYLAFEFPGVQGWVIQNFFNITVGVPPESVWKLPASCTMVDPLPSCGFLP